MLFTVQCVLVATLAVFARAYPNQAGYDLRDSLYQLYRDDGPREALLEDSHWPNAEIKLGQVGGLAVAPNDNLVVFHRGNRRWSWDTFNSDNTYALKSLGPIVNDTLVHIDTKTGKKTNSHGSNLFYMPHGLTIDAEGNHWLTDVALHQVFRFPPGAKSADLTLGTAFIPGDSDTTFCKPTDVAVASNGDFFVADGYCNSRILKFSKNGTLLNKWGRSRDSGEELVDDMFKIPHSLSLIENHDVLCVADREDRRVICYNAGIQDPSKTGEPTIYLVQPNEIGRVFAIEYSPLDKLMYAVVDPSTNNLNARGFAIDMSTGQKLPFGIIEKSVDSQPHDVTVSPNGNDVYLGDIGTLGSRVYRFSNNQKNYFGKSFGWF
ncbi:hypothetical protein LOTGIDRAFT_204047 [Lottia gigantea]|uniref:peptidylamidoglycolate lyase n=1 Tax=Lottia gigantea TaxID=225164 RepID=V4ABW7_LOTGI|nr:hypothetical protein LOTGIDRAFT_204047 [Lottia gigantea]ESO92580.1 hypothetical protein LOTGIDRAFT_204047 [Lottia gigantea]